MLDASVSGFGGNNQIDIGALPFQDDYTTSYSGTTLTILHGGAPVYTFTHINNPGAFTFSSDDDGGTEMSVCYARGTMIRTPDGEVAVQALTPGAQVMTMVDALLLPARVVWVGSRHLDLTTHPTRRLVAPFRIERGAFADGLPHRDLLVSPDHAILADGKLICARQLLNGSLYGKSPIRPTSTTIIWSSRDTPSSSPKGCLPRPISTPATAASSLSPACHD